MGGEHEGKRACRGDGEGREVGEGRAGLTRVGGRERDGAMERC